MFSGIFFNYEIFNSKMNFLPIALTIDYAVKTKSILSRQQKTIIIGHFEICVANYINKYVK